MSKYFLLFLFLFSTSLLAQGPIIINGLDTEFGERPGNTSHGSIADWANILQTGIFNNVTNGQNRILVIGGRKTNGEVRSFWNQIGARLSIPVDFKHEKGFWIFKNANDVKDVDFSNYSLIAVSTSFYVAGRLTKRELNEMNKRQDDMVDYICGGGGLFASACEYNDPYKYISKLGAVSSGHAGFSNLNPTIEGNLMGFTATNINGPFHSRFLSYPSYMGVLAYAPNSSDIAIIGGMNIGAEVKADFSLSKEVYCLGENISAIPTSNGKEVSHFWSVQESDENWGRFGREIKTTIEGAPKRFNLNNFARRKFYNFECNKYYRIKLAVTGLCTNWDEQTLLIRISCPEAKAGNDLCCTNLTGLPVLGAVDPDPDLIYEWFPKYGLSHPFNSKTFVDCLDDDINEFDCFDFTLKVKDQFGCEDEDKVRLFFNAPEIDIQFSQDCCTNTLKVLGACYTQVQWSTGERTQSITINREGTYEVVARNTCGSTRKSITIDSLPNENFYKVLNPISNKPNIWASNGTNVNTDKALVISHNEFPLPTTSIYYATAYKLDVFNKWGQKIHTITEAVPSCGASFVDRQIKWDGKINGSQVQSGIYNGRLSLKNCFHQTFVPVEVEYCSLRENICVENERCVITFPPYLNPCGFLKDNLCDKFIPGPCLDTKFKEIFPIEIQF